MADAARVKTGFARAAAALLALAAGLVPAGAEPLAVTVRNDSKPTLCAETDNVALAFSSPDVTRFRVTAVHPAYMGTLAVDRTAADFTACDMSGDPKVPATPKRVTFYETPDLWLTGYTFPAFWRPAAVPFRVGDRMVEGLHMVQLWVRHAERAEEVMVVYPPDGYWRARPLPPAHLAGAGYGSSFLIGPVETEGRPLVKLKEIAFEPDTRTFVLSFAQGGTARMRLDTLDRDRLVLDVALDRPLASVPFAALRSMYVTEFNADVARVAWRDPKRPGWGEAHVLDFFYGDPVLELWSGRLVPSRHNTSAPDMVFGPFEGK
ncbi:hypothetical protein GCM10007301_01910 [Azorhizobium oxalatiphilum]|uniref:Uncharacterized protein n=1 Tax=Azorhizobium oxalatiphilum TaxID=980631 RepID=A0A917F4L3_9HYPH|nr:hypothetical protein [Azorhizobium oxalatiphilum]GGF46016.1 hypothetical protein GCM10007301_01910 [Azorhizobium oxalatiphilum]